MIISYRLRDYDTLKTKQWQSSLVSRSPLAAFFAAVKKPVFFHSCEKAARRGLGTRLMAISVVLTSSGSGGRPPTIACKRNIMQRIEILDQLKATVTPS